MKLELLPATSGAAANGLQIRCCGCDQQATYGNAVAARWQYDREGRAFEAYYCPSCADKAKGDR